jgi:hypothetical protein
MPGETVEVAAPGGMITFEVVAVEDESTGRRESDSSLDVAIEAIAA